MSAPSLIQRTGRAAFWNAVLFPLKTVLGLLFTIVVARSFGLDAGIYITAMGVVTTLAMFTSVGIPTSLTKFLPEMETSSGPAAVALFLRRVGSFRLLLVGLVLIPVNVFAAELATQLDLGGDGVFILRLVSALVIARAVFDVCIRSINAFFEQLRSNALDLFQGSLDVVLSLTAIAAGWGMGGIFGALVASAGLSAIAAVLMTRRTLSELPEDARGGAFSTVDTATTKALVGAERMRFAGFAAFTYVFELSIYFSDKSFATPALAIILGREQVTYFGYGFNLAFMSVGLMVASFRGVYRPMFAHLRTRNDPQQLQRAFVGVSKVQLVVLLPAGVGLFVMAGDYIPLLYGAEFSPAVPIARIFIVLMYTQTIFNLGMIWLSIDERYRAVLYTQGILILTAPLFLIVAGSRGLIAASMLFGGARVLVSAIGYLICHRDYGFRFPWAFAAKVGAVAGAMGLLLTVVRSVLTRSPAAAVGLTILGVVLYFAGLRFARILGAEEIDLLERSNVPGKKLAVAWLAPQK